MNIPLNIVKNLFMIQSVDLFPYCNKHITIFSLNDPLRMILTTQGHNRKAIQFTIPTTKRYHPERLEATSCGLFCVYEYEKHKEYYTTEIDWERYKIRLEENIQKLIEN